jgi:hypothetical protein
MQEISAKTRVEQCPDCAYQLMNNKIIIVYPKERTIHRLNETGSAIWKAIEKHKSIEELARFISNEYEVDYDTALKDIVKFILQLKGNNLVVIKST